MPKSNQPKRTWRYDHEFKVRAIQLSYLEDAKVGEVAKSLDIHPYVLSRWRKEYREGKIVMDKRKKLKGLEKQSKDIDQVKTLQREVARLTLENDILKKWQRYLAEERQKNLDLSKDTER